MSKAKEKSFNPELEKYLNDMLKKSRNDPDMTLTDKMKIVDRVLKYEQLKMKEADSGFGSGFNDEPIDD